MFCKYCGKEIPEGQTCDCRANVAPVEVRYEQPAAESAVAAPAAPAAAGNDIVKVAGDAFKGVPAAAKRLLANNYGVGINLPSAVIFALGGLLLHILSWICFVGGLMGELKGAIGGVAGGFGAAAMINQAIGMLFKGIYGMAAWAGCLSYVIPLAIAFVIPVIGQLIRKEKVDLAHNFIGAASVCVLPAVLLLVAGLLSLLSFGLGAVVAMVAIMVGLVVSHRLIAKQMKSTNSVLATVIVAALLAVIVALVTWIVSSAVGGYFSGTFLQNLVNMGMDIGDFSDISDLFEAFEYFM